ncbi:MAG: hypothetical protein A3H59_00535 [Candidatus Jacksonbacteria bacterium RIFCSPLOWO2_02_FULL_43_9]|nr:MAG: hypothetical protein A3B94_02600 [Candidatus Jacksonbacteria bacterium RIFCSPHIGHO2_02_FULL_43_10]OGY70946.1 MAG: hypothetical protein A2986_01425 [Candidatus Jacksonbacteria bacterium RIFCSPLOWO2_01_FULL_44_13]OGY71809.1 MAG: hypothetical protein A3H59_00535 [Candidatus Jacksonbacteria bacterium RIFCSPLOWO2_02_FULL_43_9]HAZ16465.1 hypothetical protein [Candidatus Jacksonbacteria bacterium]
MACAITKKFHTCFLALEGDDQESRAIAREFLSKYSAAIAQSQSFSQILRIVGDIQADPVKRTTSHVSEALSEIVRIVLALVP